MEFDIHLRSFAMLCGGYEVSPVKFLSAGKTWKRSKTDTLTLSVSAGKCDETLDLCIDHTECNHMRMVISIPHRGGGNLLFRAVLESERSPGRLDIFPLKSLA